jgi:hypothetical protein
MKKTVLLVEETETMHFELKLSELPEFPDGFPDYWLNILFRNNPSTVSYQVRAVITTYVRLVEAATTEYREARSLIHKAWNDDGMGLRDNIRACAYFEACLSNMHRAVLFMRRIRNHHDVPDELKNKFKSEPQFIGPGIAEQICNVRHAIQHLDDRLLEPFKRRRPPIPENAPFALRANGPETPIPHDPGQTLKTIDRLQIGSHEIPFSDLCKWLLGMARCAEQISEYEGLSGCPATTE